MVDEAPSSGIGGAPADEGSYDFFMSYVPADEAWADWIAWQLEERLRLDGRKPKLFVRSWDIVAGRNETDSRQRALIASTRLVAILTPEYLAITSDGAAEWQPVWSQDPRGLKRLLVPVRVKECQPERVSPDDPVHRSRRPRRRHGTDRLLAGINASIESRANPPTAPAFPGGRPPEDTAPEPLFPGPPVVRVGDTMRTVHTATCTCWPGTPGSPAPS